MIGTLPSGCILFLPCENNINDISSNNFNFTVASSNPYANLSQTGVGGNYWLNPNPGVAIATGDIARLRSVISGLPRYSIELFIYMSGLPLNSTRKFIQFKNNTSNVLSIFATGPNNTFGLVVPKIYTDFTPSTAFSIGQSYTFTTGAYNRLLLTVDSVAQVLRLYNNGVQTIYSSGSPYILPFKNLNNLLIGDAPSEQYIKNVSVYDRIIGPDELNFSGMLRVGNIDHYQGYSLSLISGSTITRNYPFTDTSVSIDLTQFTLDEMSKINKILLKKNDWVAGIYTVVSGINSGNITIK